MSGRNSAIGAQYNMGCCDNAACGTIGEGPTELSSLDPHCWTLRPKQDVSSIAISEISAVIYEITAGTERINL